MTQDLLNKINKPENAKQVRFIEELAKRGIELHDINVDQYVYSVYVGVPFYKGMKQYKRFSNRDIENCVAWFKDKYPTLMNFKFGGVTNG